MPSSEDWWDWKEQREKAYAQGQDAAHNGAAFSANPHPHFEGSVSSDNYWWSLGWNYVMTRPK